MNGAEIVAEILKIERTNFIFCYPRNPVIEACAKIGIQPILCRQERVGIGMADGYTRRHRGKKIGVFAAQGGPGIENAFPGIAQAYAENVPILILSGSYDLHRQYRHPTFSATDVFKPITKWSARAHSISELPELLRRAYHILKTGKGGPVLIEVPNQVWTETAKKLFDYRSVPGITIAPSQLAVSAATEALLQAKSPILWAGQGIFYANASDELVELAELLPLPVMTTNPGKSAIAENHPLALGASTRSRPRMLSEFVEKADLIFAVGSSLTRTPFGPLVPPGKTLIHSTNNAEDINKDYNVDYAILGDARLVLKAVIAEIKIKKRKNNRAKLKKLTAQIQIVKQAWLKEWEKHAKSDEVPINQYRIISDLMQNIDLNKTIITHDSGSPREQLLPFWETTVAGSYIGWGKSTQLGYGLGLAIGSKLAEPDKYCINVMGDAAIGMTGMDLETASRYGIGILTIVFNNGIMAAERDVLKEADKKYQALTVGGNYQLVAKGLGVSSARVENPNEFIQTLKKAIKIIEKGRPYLIECMVKEGREFSRDEVKNL